MPNGLDGSTYTESNIKGILATVIVIVIILLVLWFLISTAIKIFGPDNTDKKETPATFATEMVVPKRVVTVSDIAEDPPVYTGLEVTVSASISDWVDKHGFVLETSGLVSSGQLLVISQEVYSLEIVDTAIPLGQEDIQVQVTGDVRIFDRELVESEVGFPLSEALYNGFNGRPFILAQQTEKL